MKQLLINCDMGEGIGVDAAIMPWIQCCNLACGGHAGEEKTMVETALLASEFKVNVGAHPSYPDREHFGRKPMIMSRELFKNAVFNQLKQFEEVIAKLNIPWYHVKAHGALYHEGYENERVSHWLLETLSEFDFKYLFCPSNSLIFQLCKQYNIQPLAEVFLDRRYDTNGRLVSRNEEGAVIASKEEILQQLQDFWFRDEVAVQMSQWIKLQADTFCLHGDHLGCAEAARAINEWYERLSN